MANLDTFTIAKRKIEFDIPPRNYGEGKEEGLLLESGGDFALFSDGSFIELELTSTGLVSPIFVIPERKLIFDIEGTTDD